MKPSYDVLVAAPLDPVWGSLTDVDSVLAALPGAALARDGDAVTGSLKCKLGNAQVTYRLTARAEIGEAEFHNAVIAVTGKEARGGGTLAASLTLALRSEGAATRVELSGDVEATGRGEAADQASWSKVLETLVNAVLPPPAAAPAPPRPSLTVAVSPTVAQTVGQATAERASPTRPPPARTDRRMIAVALGIVMAMLVRRRRKRRT
jgi:uncharacterized protein